ncbi:MAG TPA: multifunctional oxoglutarate decarboxylase/oxoglutarate dehydrogenase thiamine pyrophosphate-binding subunit/dihydrolipoyllysine-residue succinyltransferase subunit [Bryobacteraceae bacterium]|nr:multifunctional oxoglutarate decarboxylase/oxoglutarate dehydrogenase thiamine pyrophosphate-binding subunit/dihydrolipoyllysine-residue succinyltransferase subunit [Bryobacteraceae bacterium]
MSDSHSAEFGINSWLEDELYQQYLNDRKTIDPSWKDVFESNGGEAPAPGNGTHVPQAVALQPGGMPAPNAVAVPEHQPVAGETLMPLRGAAARIAENMNASLSIPLATSQRVIPVKVVDENRRIINEHRTLLGKNKISYTHIIGWAIVKAIRTNPTLNSAYAETNGEAFRAVRDRINLGVAVDVAGKDGARSLKVPNIKDAGSLDFAQYVAAFDDIVTRARNNKLTVQDFEGTTISLTNPGTVGTLGSVPRLMPGQGAIIATGAIDFPAEYHGVTEQLRALLGISKVMTVTCTYDHRVVQGAESGTFLGRLQALLEGEDGFYEEIFSDLKMPHKPVRWEPDRPVSIPGVRGGAPRDEVAKEAAVLQLINAYRVRGHLIADFDPLGSEPVYHSELDPATYGLTIWDLDREFLTGTLMSDDDQPQKIATLREILETLRQTYCGKIGCEYMNIQIPEQKRWLQLRMEPTGNRWPLEPATRLRALQSVIEAEEFERFLHTRFIGHKRFSLEGGESAIAILDEILERAANSNVHEAVIGMAHRGRLNVLANVVGKSLVQLFSEFEGIDPDSTQGSGDVKYHLGASGVRKASSGREIVVSVAFNPSHLEAVDPVVEGIVRPKQDRLGDKNRERVIPILIHGDAAFAGQGVVAETLNMSQLEGYTTGGTIHLVINNQIGFTTNPNEARSTPYSTDVARMVQAPIFHVNGDDPEACIRVAQMAYDYRQTFKRDVVIDMFCYRRHGHNEADDPSYTQPILYRKIRNHPSVAVQYSETAAREGLLKPEQVEQIRKNISQRLNNVYDASKKNQEHFEVQELSAIEGEDFVLPSANTAVDRSMLERVVEGITTFPDDFHVHPKLEGFLKKRQEVLAGHPMDWATAETLAFGTLVLERTPVRLSGQDSGRGTFSQRHLELYDSENGERYVPLQHLAPDQARFDVFDSSLSEYAVMGFEFGYSVADPLTLVLWEAQFGDFANGAQIMIDQFIASAESKWSQPSGLVLLLPHGYEGQGPEHSSARIERFLVLCAEDNLQVVNASSPAQYFHLLRRQMRGGPDRRGMRKPLIVFTPKRMLRHPKAVSAIQELTAGTFREVIDDTTGIELSRVRRVLLCSGQVYYDLLAARDERKIHDVAILRLEQMYPFPAGQLRDILARYPETADVVWVQEEPRNMGAWRFVQEQLQPLVESSRRMVRYAGRAPSASPAAGSLKRHQQEQAEFIDMAFASEIKAVTTKRKTTRRKREVVQ